MTQDDSMREAESIWNENFQEPLPFSISRLTLAIASALRRKNEEIEVLRQDIAWKCPEDFRAEITQLKDRIKDLEEDGNFLRKVHQEDWFDKTKMMRVFNDECKKYKSEIDTLKDSLRIAEEQFQLITKVPSRVDFDDDPLGASEEMENIANSALQRIRGRK